MANAWVWSSDALYCWFWQMESDDTLQSCHGECVLLIQLLCWSLLNWLVSAPIPPYCWQDKWSEWYIHVYLPALDRLMFSFFSDFCSKLLWLTTTRLWSIVLDDTEQNMTKSLSPMVDKKLINICFICSSCHIKCGMS